MSFQTEPTLRQIVAEASARLGGIEARHEAELLLLHVLDRPRSWLFAHATDPLAAADQAAFETLLARRVAGEPVAYLTGRRGFWTLDLEVDPATLIPRPETELLVELALERLPPDRACSWPTSAPAAVRSRWRWPANGRRRRCWPPMPARARWPWPRAMPRAMNCATSASPRAGTTGMRRCRACAST
jgi:hypothetical protein